MKRKNNKLLIIVLLAVLLITAIVFSIYAYSKYKTTLPENETQKNSNQGKTISSNELQVGDVINYNPSGTYSWNNEYATSGESFNVSKWKVLSIDKNANKIEMVPATTPSGEVTLQGTQGYNNAVKLLNDACSSLYGNTAKGITARSIAEEDFVKAGGTKWTNKRAAYANYAKYGNQKETPYTYSCYPTMYKNEANHVIDGTKTESGLKQSEQTSFIAKTYESSTNGYLKASTSIQPYQTYYNTTVDYATTASLLEGYSNILLPKGSSTTYWVASRCVGLGSSICYFSVRNVNSGYFSANDMFYSGAGVTGDSRAVFPVVSLSSQLLEKAADGTYNVK